MEEQDKGQRADLFAVIGQPLPQKPSALRRKDSPHAQQVYKGAPVTLHTPAHRNSRVCPQSSVGNKVCSKHF